MRQTHLFLFLLLLPLGGCDSNEPGRALLEGLSLRSIHDSYQVNRHNHETTTVKIQTVFLNDSEKRVYVKANQERVLYEVQQLVEGSWEDLPIQMTMRMCGECLYPVVVQPGEELSTEWLMASSMTTTPQGERWGEQNVSGTYRVGLYIYLVQGSDPADISELVPANNRFTKAFLLSDVPDS